MKLDKIPAVVEFKTELRPVQVASIAAPRKFILELDELEACFLMNVMGAVSGDPNGECRSLADKFWDSLLRENLPEVRPFINGQNDNLACKRHLKDFEREMRIKIKSIHTYLAQLDQDGNPIPAGLL